MHASETTVTFSNLPAGNYTAFVVYEGNTNYKTSNTTSKLFTVAKLNPTMTSNIKYGGNETVKVSLSNIKNPTGQVTFVVTDQETQIVILTAGQAEFSYSDLAAGNYNVTAIYSGDNNHNAVNKTMTFDVSRNTPLITLDVLGNSSTRAINITATLTPNVSGNVTFTVDDIVSNPIEILNGKAYYYVTSLEVGSHNISVKYGGNENYTETTANTTFNFDQIQTTTNLTISNPTIQYGETSTATAKVTEGADGEVKFISNVDGLIGTVNLENGVASINLSNLSIGTHIITAQYLGNEEYATSSVNKTFTINKADVTLAVNSSVTTYGNPVIITVTANSVNLTGNGIININNQNHTVSFNNGVATLNVPDLNAGNYSVTATYLGNDYYKEASGTGVVTIIKIITM